MFHFIRFWLKISDIFNSIIASFLLKDIGKSSSRWYSLPHFISYVMSFLLISRYPFLALNFYINIYYKIKNN